MSTDIKLPKDWKWVKLNEISDKISLNKIKIKQKDYLQEGMYPVVDQGQDLIGGYFNDENLIVPKEPPYIIFGDHTKIKKFINFKFIPGADGVKVLKAKEIIDSKFLFYSLYTIKIEDKGYARHFQLLEKELFPLPPFSTQQSIVSKIEELFSELDNGIANLKTAQQQLKTYRQSVLKWAFEGKLTNKNVKEGELPEHWFLIPMKKIAKFIDYRGRTPKKTNSGIPLITAKNVKMGFINDEPREYISPDDYEVFMTRGIPKINDVLFSTEAPMGNVALLHTKNKIALAQRLITFQCYDIILPAFLKYSIMNPKFQEILNKKGTGTTVKGIKAATLKELEIPVPSLKEQEIIIQEIESRLSVADKMEESINQSLQQAEALRQSILKKAFEGKLI